MTPSSATVIDFDANATTRPLPEVIEVMARAMRETSGNPGSRHVLGRQARRILDASRDLIAAILGAEPDEVVFTSGGTEANNTALFGLARGTPGVLALSPGEHPASSEACRKLHQQGWRWHRFSVTQNGDIAEDAFVAAPWEQIRLATLILAHNETGVIQEVEPLERRCRDHDIPWHLDGVQAVGKIPVNFHALGATTLSFGAHKFHGPRGIGGLLVRRGTKLSPVLVGGHQEQGLRAGTEPVALIAGMAKALELWNTNREVRTQHLTQLRDRLQDRLCAPCAPVVVNGGNALRLPNTLNIAFPGVDGEVLLVALDLAGICCSLGSACASGSTEPSPILVAMGCSADVYRSSLRLTLSWENTVDEVDFAADRITEIVAHLRNTTANTV